MNNQKSRIKILIFLIITLFLLSACSPPPKIQDTATSNTTDETVVGFIYSGVSYNNSYIYAHNQGRLYMQGALNVKTAIRENVTTAEELALAVSELVTEKCSVIFAVSDIYAPYMEDIAKAYPNVYFYSYGYGISYGDNLSSYTAKMYQARYLAGVTAAFTSQSLNLGYVATSLTPDVIRECNAFALGARWVNSDITVHLELLSDTEQAECTSVLNSLVDKRVDVLTYQISNYSSFIAELSNYDIFFIGADSPSSIKNEPNYLTSTVWNWGKFYSSKVKNIMENRYQSEAYIGGIDLGTVDLAPLVSTMPVNVSDLVGAEKAKLASGVFDVFWGPISNQAGELMVEDGKSISMSELEVMDWLVEGVLVGEN